ncbi:hypothetical protein ES703_02411 [subsurface metagenome]
MRDIELTKTQERTLDKFSKSFHTMIVEYIKKDKVYIVSFPDLPECSAKGKTAKEAISNIKNAKWTWGAACIINNHDLPELRYRKIDEQYVFVRLQDEERFELNRRAWENRKSPEIYAKSLIIEKIMSFEKEISFSDERDIVAAQQDIGDVVYGLTKNIISTPITGVSQTAFSA